MSKMSRRIVVDASVARAAGTTENPVSRRSREFLQAMLTICHRVVMTPEINREWRRHQSNFSLVWLAAMRRRKKVIDACVDQDKQESLRAEVLASGLSAKQRAAVEKDCLLVTAAWASDRLVASNDDKVRAHLAQLSGTSPELSRVVWVNPTQPAETPVQWLEAGARTEDGRGLGLHAASGRAGEGSGMRTRPDTRPASR